MVSVMVGGGQVWVLSMASVMVGGGQVWVSVMASDGRWWPGLGVCRWLV